MLSSGRSLVVVLFYLTFVLGQHSKAKKTKHLFALLGYLQGYKIGYDYALQLPPVVPIIVLPTVNQHQSVSILKTIYDNKYQGNEVKVEAAVPEKIISKNTTSIDVNDIYNDIEVTSKESIKRDVAMSVENVTEEIKDSVRQAKLPGNETNQISNDMIIKTNNMTTDELVTLSLNETENSSTISNTTEAAVGLYATANYNNDVVNNLTFTISPDESGLPPIKDNRWETFQNNSDANLSTTTTGYVYNYQIFGTTERNGPYAAALYDNSKINHVSLTTDYYVKDSQLPPAPDNNWRKFSLNKLDVNSGPFKPLAGLYYDGFLNTPLKKQELVPKYWYNYYF